MFALRKRNTERKGRGCVKQHDAKKLLCSIVPVRTCEKLRGRRSWGSAPTMSTLFLNYENRSFSSIIMCAWLLA